MQSQKHCAGSSDFRGWQGNGDHGWSCGPNERVRSDLRGDPGPKDGVINGPDDAYKAVRQRYKDGSDVVKLTVTGGVLSLAKSGDNPQFTDEELEAVVKAAKDYDFVVAVHASWCAWYEACHYSRSRLCRARNVHG